MFIRLHYFLIFFLTAFFYNAGVYGQCLSLSVTTVDAGCHGGNNGQITLTITPGTAPDAQAPFTIDLFFRASDGSLTQLANHSNVLVTSMTFTPGNGSLNVPGAEDFGVPANNFIDPGSDYKIDVRSTGGTIVCRNKTTFATVGEPTEIQIDAISQQDVTCNGGNDGSITVTTVSGGAGSPYQYSIDNGSTFQASKVFNGLTEDIYDVVVRDASGCESPATQVTLTAFDVVTIDAITSQNILCKGGNDGEIVVTTVTGGDGGPYAYSIDNGLSFQAGNTFTGLAANTYDVIVRDGSTCVSAVTQIVITEPPTSVSGSTSQVDVSCFGTSTGSITITGAGGIAPYDFSIDGGATYPQTDLAGYTFSALPAGNYNLRVRDANDCETALIPVTLDQPVGAVSGSTAQVDVSCFGASTGSITITGAGGVGPYDFSIDNGATYPAQNSADHTFVGLATGSYNLRVKDANDCETASIPVTITGPASAVSGSTTQINVTCFGASTGSVTITGAGGTGPYDFSIDGGGNYPQQDVAGYTFTNLPAGNYDLRVRDANNCETAVIPVVITQPTAALSAGTSQVDVTCFGASTGSVTITGAGGTGPYDFSIDGGGTYPEQDVPAFTFSNLAAGNYNLRVRDVNNCETAVIPVMIAQPAAAVSGSTSRVDVTCFGASSGSITITGTGGTGPYDFSIDSGATYPAQNIANHTFSSLPAGPYNLKVRDAQGCESAAIPVTITAPASAVSAGITQVNVNCFGGNTGSITITGAGGVGTYDFSIDGGATYPIVDAGDHTFSGLIQGNYSLRAKDANDCETAIIPVTITEPASAVSGSTTQVNVTCAGGSTGSITITGAGGVGPYDFSIDDGATFPAQNLASHTFSALPAGNYSLKVKDANDCQTAVIPVTITEAAAVTSVISANGPTTICATSTLPEIVFTFTGVAPFDFTYTDGTTPVSINNHGDLTYTIPAAPAGTYSMTALTDDAGCVSSSLGGSVTVILEPAPTAQAGNDQSICTATNAILAGASVGGSASTGVWSIVSQPPGGDGVFSDPNPTATPSAVTFTATVAGNYILRLTTDNPPNVCEPETDDVVITVQSGATVDAGPPQTICVGGTATLAGSYTAASGATWTTSGDGSFLNATLANTEYTPGTNDISNGTVTLTFTTAGPCASVNDDVVITIVAVPTVDAGSPQTLCSSGPVLLSGTFGGSATGLLWSSSGNGSFDDATDPFAKYTPGTNDITNQSVIITATATGSCAGISDNVTITLDPAATVDAGDGQTICYGSKVAVSALLGGSATSATWSSSGDGSFDNPSALDAVYTPGPNDQSSGNVTLTASTNNPPGPCPRGTDDILINFVPVPGDETTPGAETWIGYVYDDVGDATAIPAKINFATSKYRGFIEEADMDNMSATSTYDIISDQFDMDLTMVSPLQGTNVCGSYLNEFSVRYKMDKTMTAGIYRFTVGADDGVRLLIDGVNVIPVAAFGIQSYTTYTSDPLCISAGVHTFEIHYFDNSAQSRLSFSYLEAPALTTTSPLSLCINSPPPALTAASTDPDVSGFNWYKDGALVFTGASFTPPASTLDMTTAGSTIFTVTAIYTCGESQPVDVIVDVMNSATLAVSPQTICESGGVIDLTTLVSALPPGGSFAFTGHPGISGNNFDPTGLAGNVVGITVDYTSGSCTAPQETLNLTITNTAVTTTPASAVVVCESGPDVDLTALVSASPAGGAFTFSGIQVNANLFDPSGLAGAQTITVDYATGGCVAAQTTFQLDVTSAASLTLNNTTACENGTSVDLRGLVSASPAGGVFSFAGTGVSGNAFYPSSLSGSISINVDYDLNGCSDSGTLQIAVLASTDPLCSGGGPCASVVIVPQPQPATCTNSDGSILFNISPAIASGLRIKISGKSSTNLTIERTIYNQTAFTMLPVGTYDYEIEYGDPSCIKIGQVTIDQSGTVGTPVASNITGPVCAGTATGFMTLNVPGETGNVLEWSLDGGISDPFKPFTAGGQISGIPAGPAPAFEQVISVRRNISDPCFSSVTVVMSESNPVISASFSVTPATCNGNDGAITNIVAGGGSGAPYLFSINGGQSFQSETAFNGLVGGSYAVRVQDAVGCENDFIANVTFPGFINSAISKSDADCTNQGNSGSITVTVNDPGSYEVALTTDQFTEPADDQYQPYSNPSVTFDDLPREQYYVYVKSNTTACPTRSAPIDIFGVYDINFDLEPYCNNNTDVSLALRNVTGDSYGMLVAPLEIRVTRKFSTDPDEIIPVQFPANGEIYLDYSDHVFLKNPGEYLVKIVQFQDEVVCDLSSDIVDFTVPGPLSATVGIVDESYPDIPTGRMNVIGFSGGVVPYSVSIKLDSASSLSLTEKETAFEEVSLNGNQQFYIGYDHIPAGRYLVKVMDVLGCEIDFPARVPMDQNLFIPNVFTPNNDGSNDIFFIRNLPETELANELIISNRWGKEIFVSENYQNNWDGQGVADGIYYYRLKVGNSEPLTGWVEIMRGQKP